MKKVHKHDALIREWLDLGCPPVEIRGVNNPEEWFPATGHLAWNEGFEYRLVPPPKQKRTVKLEAWIDIGGELRHVTHKGYESWTRQPSLDLEYEVEE